MRDRQAADQELRNRVRKLTHRSGINWPSISIDCTELVIFGSQAAGLQTSSSDLDVLVVSKDPVSKSRLRWAGMDLVFRTEREILSTAWLQSELASHIAEYGQWFKGVGRWRTDALDSLRTSSKAAKSKQLRVNRLVEALSEHWDRLTPDFRRRNIVTLCRESRRYQLLQSGVAVPPTRLLDVWAERDFVQREIVDDICSAERQPNQLRAILEELVHRPPERVANRKIPDVPISN